MVRLVLRSGLHELGDRGTHGRLRVEIVEAAITIMVAQAVV